MNAPAKTVKDILLNLPEDRLEPFNKLHDVIVKNLPKGFEPSISYGALGYVGGTAYTLSGRLPLQAGRATTLCQHCFSKRVY